MSTNPNTVKSQDDLNPCNDGKRSSDVLVEAISKLETTTKELEKVKKQLDIAKSYLNGRADKDKYADWILLKIEELNK